MIGQKATDRILALDGLRAFAVLLVLVFHSFPQLYPSGSIGVDVFFVISGYVITANLLRDRPRFRTFYFNRAQRLLPPAILVIGVTWLFAAADLLKTSGLAVLAAMFSFMNWLIAFEHFDHGAGRLAHYWSLSVEEQFYLIWPLLLAFMLNRKIEVRKALLILIAITVTWRLIAYGIGYSEQRIYSGLDMRADGLLAGCLIAFWRPRELGWAPAAAIAAIALFGFLHLDYTTFPAQLRYPAIAALSVVAVAGCAWSSAAWTMPLRTRSVQWVGARSYAIYLWHYPFIGVATTLGQEWGIRGAIYIGAAWAATFVASEATYRFIEKPLRDLRHRRNASARALQPAA